MSKKNKKNIVKIKNQIYRDTKFLFERVHRLKLKCKNTLKIDVKNTYFITGCDHVGTFKLINIYTNIKM